MACRLVVACRNCARVVGCDSGERVAARPNANSRYQKEAKRHTATARGRSTAARFEPTANLHCVIANRQSSSREV
jgi:hypothetical protein